MNLKYSFHNKKIKVFTHPDDKLIEKATKWNSGIDSIDSFQFLAYN